MSEDQNSLYGDYIGIVQRVTRLYITTVDHGSHALLGL